MPQQADYSAAIQAIEKAHNILVLPSSPPDGDSLSSALALYMGLQKQGKKVTVVCADPVPEAYEFLPDADQIESKYDNLDHDFIITLDVSKTGFKELEYDLTHGKVNIFITPENGSLSAEDVKIDQDSSRFDLIITVDTADLKQLGKVYEHNEQLFSKIPVLNIDHHPSNTQFGSINLVSPSSASTTLMLTELFQAYDISLVDSDIATLLLAGLITDTGSFQNANASPEAFDTAALLIGLGARQQEIIRHVYKTKELHALRLWGRILSNIQTDYKHRMVWSTVTQADFAETNSKETDIGDIIDELLSNAPEAEIVILFKELEDGNTQLSFRTTTDEVNASIIAQNFGGGGHTRAAGARIADPNFLDVVNSVLEYVRSQQADRLLSPLDSDNAPAAQPEAPEPESTPAPPAPPTLQPEAVEPVPEPIIEPVVTVPNPEPVVATNPPAQPSTPEIVMPPAPSPQPTEVDAQPQPEPKPVLPAPPTPQPEPVQPIEPVAPVFAAPTIPEQPAPPNLQPEAVVPVPEPIVEPAVAVPNPEPVVATNPPAQPTDEVVKHTDDLPPDPVDPAIKPEMPSFNQYIQPAPEMPNLDPTTNMDNLGSDSTEPPVNLPPQPTDF